VSSRSFIRSWNRRYSRLKATACPVCGIFVDGHLAALDVAMCLQTGVGQELVIGAPDVAQIAPERLVVAVGVHGRIQMPTGERVTLTSDIPSHRFVVLNRKQGRDRAHGVGQTGLNCRLPRRMTPESRSPLNWRRNRTCQLWRNRHSRRPRAQIQNAALSSGTAPTGSSHHVMQKSTVMIATPLESAFLADIVLGVSDLACRFRYTCRLPLSRPSRSANVPGCGRW
jgi:hypothetical protein